MFWKSAKIGITSSLLCAPVSSGSEQAKTAAKAIPSDDKIVQTDNQQTSQMMDQMGAKPVRGGHDVCYSVVNGMEFLKNPKYCKGLAFSIEERQVLGIHGLLPPKVRSQEEQVDNALRNCKF